MSDNSSEASGDISESSSEPTSPEKKPQMMAKITEKPKLKIGHPSTAEMVNEAIKELAERGGSSVLAIKRYISEKYNLDSEQQSTYIKKYLKKAVANGDLVQPKGRGATGSFKMPSAAVLAARRKQAKAIKEASIAKKFSKKTISENVTSSKKQAPTKEREKSVSTANKKSFVTANKTAPKSPKAKKMAKSPTSKPKAPRPKKVTAASKSPKSAGKKTAAAKM